jgi:dTDP-4-dehydrorhamnose reductase
MRKILIFGRVGQVGWELRHKLACLGQISSLDYPDVDFTKPQTLRDPLQALKPDVIVNAAAYTAVDKAETERDFAMAINAAGPAVIAEEAKKLGAMLVHYSTDYVFNGSGSQPFTETDTPAPLNVYGETKLAGDQAIQASGCDHLIFRTSWVYGARGSNFLLTMLKLGQQRPGLSIVSDQVGAPTTSECIAQATACVLAQVLSPAATGIDGRSGVYNLTNAGEASWFQFAKAIFDQAYPKMGVPIPALKPIPTSEFPRPAQRPFNSRLSGEKLQQIFGLKLPPWEQALDLVLETLAEGASPVLPES